MIHQYKSNGYNIVMDVNSGSVHVVDDIVYDMIPLVEPLVTEGIKDADTIKAAVLNLANIPYPCLLYTSPSPRDLSKTRMPSSA